MGAIGKLFSAFTQGKGFFQVSTGHFVAAVLSGIFWIGLASIMAIDSYGELNYYLSIASILATVSILGLNTAVTNFLSKGVDLRAQANFIVLVSNLVILPFLFVFVSHLPTMLLFVGLSFFTMSYAEVLGKREYKKFAIMVIAQRALQIGLSLILYYLIGADGIIIGYAVSTMAFAFNFFRSIRSFKSNLSNMKQKIVFAIHSYIFALSSSVTNNVDKLLIGPLFGFSILGLYQMSFQFLLFLSILPMSMFQFLLSRGGRAITMKFGLIAMLLAAGIAAMFHLTVPTIISSYFPHFHESIWSAQIIVVGIIPMTLSSIVASTLLSKENSSPVLLAAISYIAALTGLVLLLGQSMGLAGLAIAIVASLTIQSVTLAV
ncbi:MAG: lipopolysaccharide biosynthesis protein, partial [Nitrososphaera sp.]